MLSAEHCYIILGTPLRGGLAILLWTGGHVIPSISFAARSSPQFHGEKRLEIKFGCGRLSQQRVVNIPQEVTCEEPSVFLTVLHVEGISSDIDFLLGLVDRYRTMPRLSFWLYLASLATVESIAGIYLLEF